MFGKPRSSLPVAGRTGIPVKRTTPATPVARSAPLTGNSSIPVPSNPNESKNSGSELPHDPKLLAQMVLNLQKQVQEKDDALKGIGEKLSRKSEECESLVEERDIMRNKNSFDLQQVSEDQDALQETLKKKDRYIQEMEARHREETLELKREIEELNGENEIEVDMLKKEMEDLKLREERWKRVAELKKESDYDSSDVGSRDHSPEVEALREQMASLQSNYEDEVTVLKEKLQTQIAKKTEATEKIEQQEFEFQEKLSELKSAFESEKNELRTEHEVEMDKLKNAYDAKLKELETTANFSRDFPQKKQYENLIDQLQEQVTDLTSQLETSEAQMAQDLIIMKNEFETQLDESKSAFESEKEKLEKTILELGNQAEDINEKHARDIEQMKEVFRKEKEEIRNTSQESETKAENLEAMQRKMEAYENEVKELKESLQNERLEFVETSNSLEGMIADQEKEFEEKEEKYREEMKEEEQMKLDKVVSEYEQRLQEAERSYFEGKEGDRTNQEFQLEMNSMKRLHEREIERLHDSLGSLQAENESLKREYDLVVTDLNNELDNSRKPGKPQIEKIKDNQEEEIGTLVRDIEFYKQKVTELESEIQRLKGADAKQLETEIELQTKTAELEYKLEGMREENSKNDVELQEYREKISNLEKQLEPSKSTHEEFAKQDENHISKITDLETQLDHIKKEMANSEAQVEEYKTSVGILRNELANLTEENQRLGSEVTSKEADHQKVTEELKLKEAQIADEVERMRGKVSTLEAEKQDLNNTLEFQSRENKLKLEKLTEKLEQMENESKNVSEAHVKSQGVITELQEKITKLTDDCEKFKSEKASLLREVQDLRQSATGGEGERDGQIAEYQSEIEKLSMKIESLENCQKEAEIEKQDLNEEIENLRQAQSVEPMITLAAVNETFAANPSTGLGLEYEQQMKGLAEDYEAKIEKLEKELEEERNKSASKTRRIESINMEIETLRQNLEQERVSDKNTQERIVKLQERHDEEVKNLKDQLAINAESNEDVVSSSVEAVKEQLTTTIKTLEADLETALQANSEQAECITDLKTQLERARHTNFAQEAEITKLSQEFHEFQQQQIAHEASITAKQVMTSEGHAKLVETLQADLETAQRLHQEQQEEITRLKQEIKEFEQQKLAYEARRTAEHLTITEGHAKEVAVLTADLDAARELNKTQQEETNELKQVLEDFQQQQIAHEANLTLEQLKATESQKAQKQELKMKMKEAATLKFHLEETQRTNKKQFDEFTKVKHERDELQKSQKRFEENFQNERLKADEASERKIKALEEEIRRKTEELSKLFSVLDTEQKGRERVLLETEKHLTLMHQAEQDKIKSERIISELKNANQALRSELIQEKEQFARYVSQSKKAQSDEQEECEKLSRSLTESEMDKGKLADEIETCKDQLNKMQEKYSKLKEKFLALKQKRKEEKEKFDEILLTPRLEMGLQTSLLEPEDLNQTREQLSSSMREQGRLEEELEVLQRDIYKKKTEIQALKRANEVLRRQNQVLYLETESLRSSGHTEGVDIPGIRKENEQLLQDKENLEIENRYLREALVVREKQEEESREKESMSDNFSETELRDLRENQAQIEQENSKLSEENEFLLKQGKRLQSQVDQLEDEIQRMKREIPVTSTPANEGQSQPLVSELIQNEPGHQLNVESALGSFTDPSLNTSLEAQRFEEENQRIREQMLVLQGRLRLKENEVQDKNGLQTGAMDDLINERQVLLSQIDSMKGALEKYGEKEFAGQRIADWDTNQKEDAAKENVLSPPSFTPRTIQNPLSGFPVSNLQTYDFNEDNYLGSAYWEATKFLDRLQQVN